MNEVMCAKLADLIVELGANVQPDQIVEVKCEPGKEYLARAIAKSAYQRGARFVDVSWFDPFVKDARLRLAEEETLRFVPSWYSNKLRSLSDHRAAQIFLSAAGEPVSPDLDPTRSSCYIGD